MYHKNISVNTKGDLLLKKKVLLLLCAIMAAGAVMYGCGTDNANTSSVDISQLASQLESQVSSDTSSQETKPTINDHIKLTDTTYETDRLKLVYPVVSQMDDATVEAKVNQLIEDGKQVGPNQYAETANLDGAVEVTFLDGETLSIIYKWTLTNPEQNVGFRSTYQNSLVIDLRTGEKRFLNEYASPSSIYYQLKYDRFQVVTDSSDDEQNVHLFIRNLVRNGTISTKRLRVADYPLSSELPPNLYGYVTQDKIGLLVTAGAGEGGTMRLEFNRKDVVV